MSVLLDLLIAHLIERGLPEPVREYRFYKGRKWRFDLAWVEHKIAFEEEGGTWVLGRHNNPVSFEQELAKYNAAAGEGWAVIRATPRMIEDGRAALEVELAWSRLHPERVSDG